VHFEPDGVAAGSTPAAIPDVLVEPDRKTIVAGAVRERARAEPTRSRPGPLSFAPWRSAILRTETDLAWCSSSLLNIADLFHGGRRRLENLTIGDIQRWHSVAVS
jgi:hypothetical protein